jgi:hypothetical protein
VHIGFNARETIPEGIKKRVFMNIVIVSMRARMWKLLAATLNCDR